MKTKVISTNIKILSVLSFKTIQPYYALCVHNLRMLAQHAYVLKLGYYSEKSQSMINKAP